MREGSTFHFKDDDKITVRTHPDVSFQLDGLVVYGRLEEGLAPVHMSDEDALIGPTPEPKSIKLLATVMPLVDSATASGANTKQTMPRILAFNLFGQGVAFFEGARTLINDRRPVEALPALRSLVIIASRFEQITDDSGLGIGTVLRMALEMPSEIGAGPELMATYRGQLIDSAVSAGITIPDELPGPETSAIYSILNLEMRLAHSAVNGTYGAIWPHLKQQDAEHAAFYTQVDPGPFTEMIASACVITQLELLKRGAKLFGWTIDEPTINDLLDEARELNEVSANPESNAAMSTGPTR